MQALDQSVDFVEFATQLTRHGVPTRDAPQVSALVSRVGGLELAGDVGDVSVQLLQEQNCLLRLYVVDHTVIVSSNSKVRTRAEELTVRCA